MAIRMYRLFEDFYEKTELKRNHKKLNKKLLLFEALTSVFSMIYIFTIGMLFVMNDFSLIYILFFIIFVVFIVVVRTKSKKMDLNMIDSTLNHVNQMIKLIHKSFNEIKDEVEKKNVEEKE